MAFKCPSCGLPLLNRRRPDCRACGAKVPEQLRITADRRQFLEEVREAERKRHAEFMSRDLPTGGGSGFVDVPGGS